MTIDDAIKRYTSNAFYEKSDGNLQGYLEFNQLAEWLAELKELKEQTEPCEDIISRQAVLALVNSDWKYEGLEQYINELPSVTPTQIIRCKDCDEWHKGKYRDGSDVYSDEGYCSVHRIITGENYYCGDAERR